MISSCLKCLLVIVRATLSYKQKANTRWHFCHQWKHCCTKKSPNQFHSFTTGLSTSQPILGEVMVGKSVAWHPRQSGCGRDLKHAGLDFQPFCGAIVSFPPKLMIKLIYKGWKTHMCAWEEKASGIQVSVFLEFICHWSKGFLGK